MFVISQFSVLPMLLDIVFLCVVSVVDRLFWSPTEWQKLQAVYSHCSGQEQSILETLFSAILYSVEIGVVCGEK